MLSKLLLIFSVFFNPLFSLVSPLQGPDLTKPLLISQPGPALFGPAKPLKLPISANNQVHSIDNRLPLAKPYLATQFSPGFLPIRYWPIAEPKITAKSALIYSPEAKRIFYQQEINQPLPVASLTKLMTALIVIERLDLNKPIIVSKEILEKGYGQQGGLVAGEKILAKNLLYLLLIESSNDAAWALAEAVEKESPHTSFVALMNRRAKDMGLSQTVFVEPSGYNPQNLSTAWEIAQLVSQALHQPLIWQILKTPVIDVYSLDQKISHHLVNTNQLLGHLSYDIIGGKTGYTEEAQGCMVLVTRQPFRRFSSLNQSAWPIITIVLGSSERFADVSRLINWLNQAYLW